MLSSQKTTARVGLVATSRTLVDGAIPDGRLTVEERDRAVVAAVGTASRRYRDRLPVPASLAEVPARCRHTDERSLPARDVNLLQPPAASVVQQARPRVLGPAHDDGVGVASGLLRKSRRMRSADHDTRPSAAKPQRDAVGLE